MSLDVYLESREATESECPHCGSRVSRHEALYESNITHNLGAMASQAGIYQHLWRPEELNIQSARELIEPLRAGLALLKSDPTRFEAFNSPNGWGTYEHFVPFVEDYLRACKEYPDAIVRTSR